MRLAYEVTLPCRVLPQPVPALNAGGDCGACVLGGLLVIKDVAEVYRQYTEKGEATTIRHDLMMSALRKAECEGLLDRIILDTPTWPVWQAALVFGSPSWQQGLEWFGYVRMALDAGYYGLARVDMFRKGAYGEGSNHWVLLCGVRELRPEGSGAVKEELLISNSSRSAPAEEWVERDDFLQHWGGFNLFLARPRRSICAPVET